MSHELAAVEAALGGELATLELYLAISPAARRAICRIADVPGEDEPSPAACVEIAIEEGADPEVVLAVAHGYRPEDLGGSAELAAAIAIDDVIGDAIDETDPEGE